MANFIKNRIAELEGALPDTATLQDIHQSIDLTRKALLDIKSYLREHPFAGRSEEIHYFRVVAPPLYGRLFYYVKVQEMGVEGLLAGGERMEAFLRLELAKIDQFFDRHGDFCRYFHSQASYMDDRVFIRDARENGMLDCVEVIMAEDFCVGCYWAALLWANQELRGYFTKELGRLMSPSVTGVAGSELPELEWTDSQTDAVELMYGLYLKGSFNGGKATLKQIAAWMEGHLKMSVGNYYNTVKEIARRKKGQTVFIDEMREKMVKRFTELD